MEFPAEVTQNAIASCVLIEVETKTGKGHGSGVRFTADGWIATNFHVIAGATKITVSDAAGQTEEITELLYTSPQRDIALFKSKFPKGGFSKFKTDAVTNEPVIAVGNPRNERWKVTSGRILKVASERNRDEIEIDAVIAPGSSGGPIVSRAGTVCGLSTYLMRLVYQDGKYEVTQSERYFGVSKASIVNIPGDKLRVAPITELRAFGEGWTIYDQDLPLFIAEVDILSDLFYGRIANQVLRTAAAGSGKTVIGGDSATLKFRYQLSDPDELRFLIQKFQALAVFIATYFPKEPEDANLREAFLLLKASLKSSIESATNLLAVHGLGNDQGDAYFARSTRARTLAVSAIRDAIHCYAKARGAYGDHSNVISEQNMDVAWKRYIPSAAAPWVK